MKGSLRSLSVLFLSTRPRRFRNAAAWLVPIAVIGLAVYWRALTEIRPFDRDFHATVALDLAISDAYCGQPGRIASGTQQLIGRSLADDPSLMHVSFPELLRQRAAPWPRYCDAIDHPFINNENSTMLLMDAVLRVAPQSTPAGLGLALTALKVLPLLLFAFVLLTAGSSPVAAIAVLLIGLDIQADLEAFRYSIYGFLVPMLLLMTSVYVVSLSSDWTGRLGGALVTVAVAGFLTGFAANLRTSHLPVYLAMFLLYAVLAVRRMHASRSRWGFVIGAAVLFAGAYALFGRTFIARITPPVGTANNYTHHPIMHPIVLALGVPRHRLAVREGIEWDDMVGPTLAHRMIPDAEYLGRDYEHALLLYYVKLWMLYPSEMRNLYRHKFQLAGTGMFEPLTKAEHQGISWALPRLVRITDGRTLLEIYAIVFVASILRYYYTRRPLAAAVSFLALAGILLFLESAIIMSRFFLTYHAYLLFFTAFTTLLIIQMAVEIAAASVHRLYRGKTREDVATSVAADQLQNRTIADFGEQWTTYVDNSGYYGSAALFDDVFSPFLSASDLKETLIAEIGSGSGRWVRVFLDAGATHVVALEPSAAIDVLRGAFASEPNRVELLHLAGDRLPPRGDRDYVFSIGVLHHIPDPGPVCRAAMGALKPGATLGVWLYGREGNEAYLALFGALHGITRRLPHRGLALLSWILGWGLEAYIAACRVLPLPLRAYASNVLAKLSRDKRRLVIYDQLNPAYAKYYTRDEALALLEQAGFEDVRVHHRHGYSWTVVGRRPS